MVLAPLWEGVAYPVRVLGNRLRVFSNTGEPSEAGASGYYDFELNIGGVVERNTFFI